MKGVLCVEMLMFDKKYFLVVIIRNQLAANKDLHLLAKYYA